jgi:hypothetical protein
MQTLTRPPATFDRTMEDVGNIVALEHVNVTMPDQHLATLFYVVGLGLTRDPYLSVSDNNMWVNIGRSQFHLPTGQPQVLRGHVGLFMKDRASLIERLHGVADALAGTHFHVAEHPDYVEATCPWGNRIRVYEHDAERFGPTTLGISYVEFDVPIGAADGIGRFYTEFFHAPHRTTETEDGTFSEVTAGRRQYLVFRETSDPLADYDGHHLQVYLAQFSGAYNKLLERGLITREDGQYQYRFQEIVDPVDGRPLFQIEHEVRALTHPMYARPLVNRNPVQTQAGYAPGADAWHG